MHAKMVQGSVVFAVLGGHVAILVSKLNSSMSSISGWRYSVLCKDTYQTCGLTLSGMKFRGLKSPGHRWSRVKRTDMDNSRIRRHVVENLFKYPPAWTSSIMRRRTSALMQSMLFEVNIVVSMKQVCELNVGLTSVLPC